MATSRVRGHRERLLLSANEVGTWGSVSLRLRLPAPPCAIEGGGSSGYECLPSDTNAIFSYRHPGLQAALIESCRVRGVTHIRFNPVGKITNGSKIAVPESGSSLSNEYSHASSHAVAPQASWMVFLVTSL